MSRKTLAEELDRRAAAIRRAAGSLRSPQGRDELLRIADGYEAEARGLRRERPLRP